MKLPTRRESPSGRLARLMIPLIALIASTTSLAGATAADLTPKSVPVQVRLAEEMAANEDWDEATRRWIDILYYFGPSDQEARAEFELGVLGLRRGRSSLAISHWQETVLRNPDSEWARRAREGLERLGKEVPAPLAGPAEPYITTEAPPDERQFLCAQCNAVVGLYEFAIRDYLKISNLYPTSSRAPEARFRIGTCQALLGRPQLAIHQWDRVVQEYPGSREAQMARAGAEAWYAVLGVAGTDVLQQQRSVFESQWRPFRLHATEIDRGLSYAEDLFENGIPDYALQEYAKVLCDIYMPSGAHNPHRAYARYRMGVCAYRLGQHDAAARQWRRLLADYPDSPWAQHVSRALAVVGATDSFSSDGGRPAPPLPSDLASTLIKRHHLADQLVDCGLPLIAAKEYLKVIFVLTAGDPNPLQAEAYYKLGLCQHLRGRPDLARRAWEQTIAGYPATNWADRASTSLSQAEEREKALAISLPEPTP